MRDDLVKNKQSVLTLLQTYRIQATQLQVNPEKNIVDPNGKVLPAKEALEILEQVTIRAEEVLNGVNEALDRVCIVTPTKFGLPPISTKRISHKYRKIIDDQLVGRAKSKEDEV